MIRQMMDYYRLTGDTRFMTGIPAAIEFLESQKLPASEVAKWERKTNNPDAFLAPRFIDPDSGKPLYVHRVGSNSYNGHYFINQEISGTIGHYSSASWVDTKALRKAYDELMATPVEELTKNSPLAGDELVPLDRFYCRMPQNVSDKDVKDIISSLSAEGCWLTPLTTTSNPYKPGAPTTPSSETKYVRTNVGDEYDTSPYRCETGEMCISTREYMNRMMTLISFVDKENK